jgi:para-nitrobenzyl esterase
MHAKEVEVEVEVELELEDGTRLRGTREGPLPASTSTSTAVAVDCFRGVPFAQAPVGELRWRPPLQWHNPNTSEVLDATSFGHTCVQWLW